MSRLSQYLESVKKSKKEKWAEMDLEERAHLTGNRKKDLEKAIMLYTGKKIKNIEILPDPKVDGTYAIDADGMQFLITRYNMKKTYKDIIDNLEEVEFASWPPKSGNLEFGF